MVCWDTHIRNGPTDGEASGCNRLYYHIFRTAFQLRPWYCEWEGWGREEGRRREGGEREEGGRRRVRKGRWEKIRKEKAERKGGRREWGGREGRKEGHV